MQVSKAARMAVILGLVGLVASCGSSGDGGQSGEKASGKNESSIQMAAEDVPYAAELEAAGYRVVAAKPFPSQHPGRRSNVVVYRSRSEKDVGGVIYTARRGNEDERIVWHWHFTEAAPDSVTPVELNDDGLWDVRIYMNDGAVVEYVQDVDFTLRAPMRDDEIAMNGRASEPSDLWKVFDGDTTSSWRSSLGGGGAWIDVAMPMGVKEGILRVRLAETEQPAKCVLRVDGKDVQQIDLEETSREQLFQLDESARDASSMRVVFSSPRGDAEVVAVSELGVK